MKMPLTLAETYPAAEPFSCTYPLDHDGSVRLSNINGSIVIKAWDRNEVRLEAEKRAPDAKGLARIHIIVDATPDSLVVKTEHQRTARSGGEAWGLVSYRLKVPSGARLRKIDAVNAGITVKGVHGPVRLQTVNGEIDATGLGADAKLDTVNGAIRAAFDLVAPHGEISAGSVNGSCEVRLPEGTRARVDLASVTGGMHCSFPGAVEGTGGHRLRGSIGGPAGALIRLRTVNGRISLSPQPPEAAA